MNATLGAAAFEVMSSCGTAPSPTTVTPYMASKSQPSLCDTLHYLVIEVIGRCFMVTMVSFFGIGVQHASEHPFIQSWARHSEILYLLESLPYEDRALYMILPER